MFSSFKEKKLDLLQHMDTHAVPPQHDSLELLDPPHRPRFNGVTYSGSRLLSFTRISRKWDELHILLVVFMQLTGKEE